MSCLAATLNYAALITLALAMTQHYCAVFRRDLSARLKLQLRITGWVLLAASFTAMLATQGWEMGMVAWFAVTAISGFLLTLLLTFAPRFSALPLAGLLIASLF